MTTALIYRKYLPSQNPRLVSIFAPVPLTKSLRSNQFFLFFFWFIIFLFPKSDLVNINPHLCPSRCKLLSFYFNFFISYQHCLYQIPLHLSQQIHPLDNYSRNCRLIHRTHYRFNLTMTLHFQNCLLFLTL